MVIENDKGDDNRKMIENNKRNKTENDNRK